MIIGGRSLRFKLDGQTVEQGMAAFDDKQNGKCDTLMRHNEK